MIRDLMLATVEHRFGGDARRVPHAIEWLSDNGSCYTAHETVAFGESLGAARLHDAGLLTRVQRHGRGLREDLQA